MSTPAPGRDRQDRLQRIVDTQLAIVQADFDLDKFMQIITNTVQELTEASGAVVELVDGDSMVYRCASGNATPYVGLRLKREGSLSGYCVAVAEVLCCEDAETDPRVDREACRRVGVSSMICAPLFRMGEPVGVLKVMSEKTGKFDADDIQTLTLLGGMLGAALGKQLAFDALQHAESRLRLLLENAQDAVVSVDESGTLLRWNRAAERLFGWSAAEVIGSNVNNLVTGDTSVLGSIFTVQDSPVPLPLDLRQELQLTVRDGHSITVEYSVGSNAVGSGREITAFVHDISLRKSLENAMRDLALSDSLTGMPNRRAAMEALHGAIVRSKRCTGEMALLFMDMNGFKQINDVYGHEVGDHALQEFARRIRAPIRESDVAARLGGDEFVVMAEGIAGEAGARTLAGKIVQALEPPMAEHGIQLATSIGICLYQPGWTAGEWLKHADEAMYQAKRQPGSGSRIALHSPSITA